ncbi:hypothetical protein CC2G_003160 [Coprinopsis cinerea AmutBmut pab1-1]|nr:hypothetical protein CC2G_003160 [Coprinopsis cinerea AmutBmut pab1-1]
MEGSSSIQSLPDELVEKIGDLIGMADMKSLRLTCRAMGALFQPAVLRRIVIKIHGGNLQRSIPKLQSLSESPSSPSKELIRELQIDDLIPMDDYEGRGHFLKQYAGQVTDVSEPEAEEGTGKEAEEVIKDCLPIVITSLLGLNKLVWRISAETPMWALDIVAHAIHQFGHRLTSFDLEIGVWEDFTPELAGFLRGQDWKFPNLQHLTIRAGGLLTYPAEPSIVPWVLETLKSSSSTLASLDIDMPCQYLGLHDLAPCVGPSLTDITLTSIGTTLVPTECRLPSNFRNLVSLDLSGRHNCRDVSGTRGSVWTALQNAHVWFRKLHVHGVTEPLLAYLSAHPGPLEDLALLNSDTSGEEQSNEFARTIFTSILPKHKADLKHLLLDTNRQCEWCITEQTLSEHLQGFVRLEYLLISVAGETVLAPTSADGSEKIIPEFIVGILSTACYLLY